MSPHRKVALITGAGTGVGRACALRFARLGFDVAINYSRSEADALETSQLVRDLGVSTVVVQCDVSKEADVIDMVKQVEAEFGRLDVLVNNAAMTYFIPGENLEQLTEDKWDRILEVNLKGAYFCTKAAAKLLSSGDGGAVVNVSSVAGVTGRGSSIAYSASKGAMNTMTKSFAHSLAPHVRVNAVLPGPIDSRWIREGDTDWDVNEMCADFPIPRPSQPDEIADGVIFFATGTAMTTGQLLAIDGGMTI